MTDIIALLLGLFEDLKFWKKKRGLEKKKRGSKNVILDLSGKIFVMAIIIILLLKLFKLLF